MPRARRAACWTIAGWVVAAAALLASNAAPNPQPGAGQTAPAQAPRVRLGIEVLLEEGRDALAGKRLGLVTNPSGVDSRLVATADRLAADKRWKLTMLFGPEHGVRGDVLAGESVANTRDAATGVAVESLYGDRKRPSAEALASIDAILFDIQDVGSRTYTYISTLGEVLRAAADARKPVWVLDRPNPLGGILFEGPVREDRWQSFIGYGPMPVSHGMTVGEVARFFVATFELDVELHVVEMRGWTRSMTFEETGLPWVPTSPHIPHPSSARAYIATGMLGGILGNVNEGVGWTLPFETLAAEFVEPRALIAELARVPLPGVVFRETHYQPRYGKFQGKSLHGVQLHVTDAKTFRPLRTALTLLCALHKLYGKRLEFGDERSLGIHWGNLDVFEQLRAGKSAAEIEAGWQAGLDAFAERRRAALIYR